MFEVLGKYAEAKVFTEIIDEKSLTQIGELCNQPMFNGAKIRIMPDVHAGKGCVIGFTAKLMEKKIVPNLVGVDIGCGVITSIFTCKTKIDFKKLDDFIKANIPSGFSVRPNPAKLPESIINDVKNICLHINEPEDKYERHIKSIGSLGGGNHYIEMGQIDENTFALSVHTGSRNLGKKVCEFYQDAAIMNMKEIREKIALKHKTAKTTEEHESIQDEIKNFPKIPEHLAYLEGEKYFDYVNDMLACTRIAEQNRSIIAEEILGYLKVENDILILEKYHTVHNYIEACEDGTILIRKGAVKAEKGQLLAIPLNMRDGVILGVGKGNDEWNCSAPHGAGRLMSRGDAKRSITLEDFQDAMKGINSWSVGTDTLDESPQAYKPAAEIINAVDDTIKIKDIVKPIYNFKAGGE